jgi:S-DNA-T family DNA segregation ATPase FtsK/SpoIIIE
VDQHGLTSATEDFIRGPRLPVPAIADGDVVIAAPPVVPRPVPANVVTRLLPVVMVVAMAGMVAVALTSGSSAARNPMFLMFPVMMLGSLVAGVVQGGNGGRRAGKVSEDRRDYLGYLQLLGETVSETAEAQRRALQWCHPDTESLWMLVGGVRMWERRSTDSDFCRVRVGVGAQPLATGLVCPETGAADERDPVTVTALRRFVRTHSTVSDVPIALALRGLAAVTVDGDAAAARGLLRAMICQLAVLHSPRQLMIVAVVSDEHRAQWEWLKWLPHQQHPSAVDIAGSARMVYGSLAAAETALAGYLVDRAPSSRQTPDSADQPQFVVVVDGDVVDGGERIVSDGGINGLAVLEVGTSCDVVAAGRGLRLRVTGGELATALPGSAEVFARPDRMTPVDALVCARRLAPYRAGHLGADEEARRDTPSCWQDLLGVGDPGAITPDVAWRSRSARDRLRVPVGTTVQGAPVELDIKEAAENGMGPHGLCVGATGSGKSEFLRTVVLGMVARHSPESLNLVLVDFKGGATFLGLDQVRHVAAVITNLSDEAHLVARMKDALAGEMNRRQELLRAAGNVANVAQYERARRAGAEVAPLPALFIIVDEFSELLSQHPDFADLFVAIGRQGRSLGMHLLLASQRLDEGRLRGLESHLSYRVCLKTLSANESRIVLGVPDAYQLPNTPGAAYLRTGTAELIRFQTAFVSGQYSPAGAPAADTPRAATGQASAVTPRLFTAAPMGHVTDVVDVVPTPAAGRTVLATVLDRLAGHGPGAHEVWLPPLDAPPTLDAVLPHTPAALTAHIGLVDCPFEQRRMTLTADLSGAAGNVAVVGAPQSGKSTTLRTLMMALAVGHDPRNVQFYCLDFGGGTLASARSLPQVGSVATRVETELVRRTVAELSSIVRSREAAFRDLGIDSAAEFRRRKAAGDPGLCTDRFGDVFLVIDGWATVRQEFEALEGPITALAAQGLSFGVHVVVSASRWADIRPALRDQIGTRIELRLGDPADSELDRKQAQRVPEAQPGRGLTRHGRHMVIALPRLDGTASGTGLTEATAAVGAALRRRHGDCSAPPVRLLPSHIEYRDIVHEAADASGTGVLLGVGERELRPIAVNFDRQAHLLILGDGECGKTAVLRTLCREITRTRPAERAKLVIVDFRRTLLGVVETDHLDAYAGSGTALAARLPDLLDRLRARMPGPDITQEQLRARSWWSGPDIYLVVDDYDLVATAGGNPLTPILDFLPHAKDIGLHLLAARRCGGAARAMFEPVLAGLRDLGCMGLLMSGNPDEGPLVGSVRPAPLPAGRGVLITRAGGEQLVQVAWSSPP